MPTLPATLTQILNALRLDLPTSAQQKLLAYLDLLDQWNRVYNLTAIQDPHDRMVKHIADSLAVAPYLRANNAGDNKRWLDVGSGAGLPGIPLSLAFPTWQWTLLDSNAKKTRFLVQAKATLQLENVHVVQARVETFNPSPLRNSDPKFDTMPATGLFDGIICRAWASLAEIVAQTRHLYAAGGRLYAMKGIYPQAELAAISQPYEVIPITVPLLNEQRHLVRIDRVGNHE